MKQYDKNSLIGFALMAIILIVFNTFFFPEIPKEETTNNTSAIEEKKSLLLNKELDFTAKSKAIDSLEVTTEQNEKYGAFASSCIGQETFYTIENKKTTGIK